MTLAQSWEYISAVLGLPISVILTLLTICFLLLLPQIFYPSAYYLLAIGVANFVFIIVYIRFVGTHNAGVQNVKNNN